MSASQVAATLQRHFPSLRVLARADTRYDAYELLNAGLDEVYRFLDGDYENQPTYVWEVQQQGPVIGYTWSF